MIKKEKIPLLEAIPVALQHVIAMVVGCITVPVVLSSTGLISSDDKVIMMQAALLCAGLAILIQAFGKHRLGSGLPVIVGSGFAFIPTLTLILKNGGMSAVLGAQLVGACVGILVGLFFKRIRFLFPTIVTASVVITIGISLYPTAVDYMAGHAGSAYFGSALNWMIALITLAAVLFFSHFCKGVLKVSAILLGVAIGYLVSMLVGIVDFTPIQTASMIALPQPFHFGMSFGAGAIASMSLIFIINAIQDMGQLEATAEGAFHREATDQEIAGGVIGDNLTSAVGAFIGGTPNAICGQNVGIVVTTNITDKLVFILAAVIILTTALIPKFAALFLTIPYPVLGGATITVFGSIAMTGIRMLNKAGLTNRNLAIAGLAIALAVGLKHTPGAFDLCPSWVQMIFGGSEIVIVAIVSIALEFILPKEKERKE